MRLSQRFPGAMRCRLGDRMRWVAFGYGPQTPVRWKEEGLREGVTATSAPTHFGFDTALRYGLGEITERGSEAVSAVPHDGPARFART